jgi:cell division protein FtsW
MALDRFRAAHKANPDFTYMTLIAILVLFGLVMISSSSVVVSMEVFNRNYGFVTKQAIALGIGIVGAIMLSRIDYHVWRRLATPILVTSFILLLIVFLPGIGKSAKGAARWINLGFFQLQPSELVKISYILYLAAWFERRGDRMKFIQEGLLPFVVLLIPVVGILMLQRDLGTLLVVLVTAGIMFFVSGAPYSHLGIGVLSGIGLIALLIIVQPYRMQRLETFLNPSADKLGSGYHINQALLAVGSGGAWGKGFGKSLQKYLYLPEPHTDSIFAIITEELGFFRALLVLAVIGLVAYRGYQIASRAPDDFGRMAAFGITSWFLFQSIINLGAILGLLPLTGVPLPFISYGGTALIISLAGVGIMINISRYSYGK